MERKLISEYIYNNINKAFEIGGILNFNNINDAKELILEANEFKFYIKRNLCKN